MLDLRTVALCAVIGGADTWVAVGTFGEREEAFPRRFLAPPHGMPAPDTSGRVSAALDPAACGGCCLAWVRDAVRPTEGRAATLDGETRRRAPDRPAGRGPPPRVVARATANQVVLGPVAVGAKSHGRTALPALRRVLARNGGIVASDAVGCRKGIARAVRPRRAGDVLARRDDHPPLAGDAAGVSADALGPHGGGSRVDRPETWAEGPGRIEWRRRPTIADPAVIRRLDPAGARADRRPI